VERGNIVQKEYKEMPFVIPSQDDARLQKVLYHLNRIESLLSSYEGVFDSRQKLKLEEHKQAIDTLVFDIYGLHPVERQLVEDTLAYGVEFFNWAKRKTRKPRGAAPVRPPGISVLKAYAEIFIEVAKSLLQAKNQTLNATIYKNGAPLSVLSFDLVGLKELRSVQVVTQPGAMQAKLRKLNDLALERNTPSFYTRRHVRIYDGEQLSIIRPSERRFWSRSQARVDADEFLADLMV
jgi:hypothetical protein